MVRELERGREGQRGEKRLVNVLTKYFVYSKTLSTESPRETDICRSPSTVGSVDRGFISPFVQRGKRVYNLEFLPQNY